jgi:hypothetical protein
MAKSAKTPVSPGDAAESAEVGSPKVASPEAEAGSEAETAPDAETAATDDLDETKRKFREALDRKKHAHANDTAAAGARAAGKANGAGGPATSRRQFRRKSG